MRIAPLVLIAGCSFSGPSSVAATDDDAAPDAGAVPDDATASTPPDAPTTATLAPCSTTDTFGLIACYELEDDFTTGVVKDSSPNHLDASAHGLTTVMRDTSRAARVMATNTTYVAQTGALDRASAFTLALWVNPAALPASGKVLGILDHEQQYAMAIGDDGTLRCILTGGEYYEWADGMPANTWSMAACTWDGTNLCAYRWTSPTDHAMNCFEPDDGIASTGAHGLAIGSLSDGGAPSFRFDGALDAIHIYDRALSKGALCAAVDQMSINCL